ncbi:MAG: peroxiredoxin [Bacteroidales bacterium]|jgi:peroxiredoxin (alkyl hydroperoxide reductase subunit C)|nr:peroxiredoxin [Bacteroidales bacterium]
METTATYIPMPRLGEKAPAFTANTTQGQINFPEDFKGKWVILFSHPADFTPICTSEFITFGSLQKEFDDLNCQLIGLSIDSLSSHIAWLRTIKEKIQYRDMKNIEITFPLIDDIKMEIAHKYGMIQPGESDTKAVRAVFFIDSEGTIRTILYYPLNLGRNFDELKRVLIGLQTADAFKVALPADWRLGDEVVLPAPGTMESANARTENPGKDVTKWDWFFCTKKLPKELIEQKIFQKK